MRRASPFLVALLVLLAGAAAAVWDLRSEEARTVVVYTTPALRDLLENDIAPRFAQETGYHLSLVYLAAGQQYNRLRMSRDHQEASVFLHASPLYLAKGAEEGFFAPFPVTRDAAIPDEFKAPLQAGGRIWYGFAWSPLVAAHGPDIPAAPDLAASELSFGFPHPLLSNNGVYAALLFEQTSPDAGRRAVERTVVQPVNARANVGGLSDGSFQLTLGYEAVTLFFRAQGAPVAYEVPVVAGERVTTPVVATAGLVAGGDHPGSHALVEFLFSNATQARLGQYYFRPVVNVTAEPPGLLDLGDARVLHYDWSRWAELEETLIRYVVST